MHAKQGYMWKTSLLYAGLLFGMLGRASYALAQAKIDNPISSKTIPELIVSVTTKLTPFVITLAIFTIVIIGFQFIVAAAQGKPDEIKKARDHFMWALVGTAIVVGATVIVKAVQIFLEKL